MRHEIKVISPATIQTLQPLSFDAITIDTINSPAAVENNYSLAVLRLDKVHPAISGNKIFKLHYYLEEAMATGKGILTWGGAYSNHIIATANACKQNNIEAIGIIRGERPAQLSHTLQQTEQLGMQLVFSSREDYRLQKLPVTIDTSGYIVIPEGGYGIIGAKGAGGIAEYIPAGLFTHILCAVGTGTTLAGIINATDTAITGISVMKGNTALETMTRELLADKNKPVSILHDYHFGGYAKYTGGLISFMNDFYRRSAIPSDFVYTAKLFYAVEDLLKKGFFPAGSSVLAVHSGGLQGNLSLDKGTLIF